MRLLDLASPSRVTKGVLAAACLMVVGVVIWQATTLNAPLFGEHNWRQADTYSVAYNFVHDGATFLYPKVDWNRGRSGVMGMETPVYTFITAQLMRVLGDAPLAGRLVSWLALLFGLGACFWAFRPTPSDWPTPPPEGGPETTPDPRWLPIGLVSYAVLSPLFFFEGRQIQPDPMMGGLTAAAAAFFHAFAKRERVALYVLAMAVYCLAVGAKSPAVIAGPALWLLSFSASPQRSWKQALLRGLPFVLPLALYVGWDRWAHHLNEAFNGGERYFAIDINLREYVERFRRESAMRRAFRFVFPSYAGNWVLFPVLLTGLLLAFRRGLRELSLPMLLWLVIGIFFCAGSERLTWHWYYTFMLMLPIYYFGGVGLAVAFEGIAAYPETTRAVRWGLWQIGLALCLTRLVGGAPGQLKDVVGASYPAPLVWTSFKWFPWLLALQLLSWLLVRYVRVRDAQRLATLVFVLGCALALPRAIHDLHHVYLWRSREAEWPDMAKHWEPMRRALDEVSTRDDLFLVDGDNPWWLYLALRKGFVHGDPPKHEELRRVVESKTRFYLHFTERGQPYKVFDGQRLVRKGERWELYCLDAKGCDPR